MLDAPKRAISPAATKTVVPACSVAFEIHDDIRAIEAEWRALEGRAGASAYQRFDWLAPWIETAAAAAGIRPVLVLGRRDGRVVLALPLGVRRVAATRLAGWLGGDHANLCMPLIDPELGAELDVASVEALYTAIAQVLRGVDALLLESQPVGLDGKANPFALHPTARPCTVTVPALSLQGGFDAVLSRRNAARKKKKHRWQTNAVAEVGGFKFRRATTPEEANAIFDAFRADKSAWFRARGIADVFDKPGVDAFYRKLAERTGEADPAIEFYAIEIAGKIRATFAGAASAGHFSGFFSSISEDEWTRISPGELLLFELIRDLCGRGLESFDLGHGADRYKASWCDTEEAQVSTSIALTLQGRLLLGLYHLRDSAEGAIRRAPPVFERVRQLRKMAAGLTGWMV